MLYLIITILLNVLISAIFKLFPKYDIDAFQAIVTNYCVCVITGCLYIGAVPFSTATLNTAWFPWSLITGVAFIALFNLIAYNTKCFGITTTTIANKLSLVIPVVFSVVLYHENAGIGKIAGIILAFPAVYLTTRQKKEGEVKNNLFWPVLLFIGSGLLDTLLKYMQCTFLATAEVQAVFSIYTFATAAVTGIVVTIILVRLKKTKLQLKNIVAGICVGVPNYFSIYFLIRTLNSSMMQSSATIPVVNIGILVASSIVAILLFRERANTMRIIGLALSIIAILLIALGDK
jgi:drug/metabolite transporter (DMT)-like permease